MAQEQKDAIHRYLENLIMLAADTLTSIDKYHYSGSGIIPLDIVVIDRIEKPLQDIKTELDELGYLPAVARAIDRILFGRAAEEYREGLIKVINLGGLI